MSKFTCDCFPCDAHLETDDGGEMSDFFHNHADCGDDA